MKRNKNSLIEGGYALYAAPDSTASLLECEGFEKQA